MKREKCLPDGKDMKQERMYQNIYHNCRLERHSMVMEHCVAAVDWLIQIHGMPSRKLSKVWSVLKIEDELDQILMAKTGTKQKKSMKKVDKKSNATSTPTTPVKAPKNRRQKMEHTKVSLWFIMIKR